MRRTPNTAPAALTTGLATALAAALAASLALAAATPASAMRGNAALKRYCSGDAATFCGDIEPGSRRMEACFRKHQADLTPRCRRAIEAYRAGEGR